MSDKPRKGDLETLLLYLSYDEESGIVTFKIPIVGRNGQLIEVRNSPSGYLRISWCGSKYLVHRLIFRLKGLPIPEYVDHINLDKSDNRWENLRATTKRGNNTNTGLRKNNTSGFKGVRLDKRRDLWWASISHHKKTVFLGYYKTPEEAAVAYDAAVSVYHGDFGRRNFDVKREVV